MGFPNKGGIMCERNIFELELLDNILNFQPVIIPENTRFWMIRTQGGYFYNEFLSNSFVAIAWNNIDECGFYSAI